MLVQGRRSWSSRSNGCQTKVLSQNSAHVHAHSCTTRISAGPSEIVCYSKCLAQCTGSCMTHSLLCPNIVSGTLSEALKSKIFLGEHAPRTSSRRRTLYVSYYHFCACWTNASIAPDVHIQVTVYRQATCTATYLRVCSVWLTARASPRATPPSDPIQFLTRLQLETHTVYLRQHI